MSKICHTYEARALPATNDAALRTVARGDIGTAATDACRQLLDCLSNASANSITVEQQYEFLPARSRGARQRPPRVKLCTKVSATAETELAFVDAAFTRGPLQTLYNYVPAKNHRLSLEHFHAYAVVCRDEALVRPGVTRECNPWVPNDFYYHPKQLKHNEGNGLLALDLVSCNLKEPVVIRVAFAAADIQELRAHLASLLRQTREINRTWSAAEDDLSHSLSLLDDSPYPSAYRYSPSAPARTQDIIADTISHELQRVYETLFKACLQFNIQIWARTAATAQLVASIVASSIFQPDCCRIMTVEEGRGELFELARHAAELGEVIPMPTHEALPATTPPFRYRRFEPLATIGAVEALVNAFPFPVADSHPLACFRKSTSPPPFGPNDLLLGYDDYPTIILGKRLRWRAYGISPRDILTHMGILGLSGSGKSNTKQNLILQCIQRGWPFLVLELAKTEGRAVKLLARHTDPELRVPASKIELYTPGIEAVSPLRLNPFDLFPGLEPPVLVDIIARAFQAAFAMGAPMPELLREALNRLLLGQSASRELTLDSLLQAVVEVMDGKDYRGELSGNLRGALDTRLNSLQIGALGATFRGGRSIPDIAHIAASQTIMELHLLVPEQAAFVVFLLLNALYHHFLTHPHTADRPRFVIFIEELHVIASPDSTEHPSDSHANTKGYAANLLDKLLCEFRALKAALCLINQTASALPPGIFKNMGTLIAHAQQHEDERTLLAKCMNLTNEQADALAVLEPGQAILKAPRYREPIRIWTPNMEEVMEQCRL